MNQAEIICTLLIAVAALAMLAKKVALPYPVLLVIGGLALGFVPGLPAVKLEPDMVFLFLLPPLLYPAALFTSWRDFRANLSPILLLAIGLVLLTTVFVAVVAHALTGLPWATAFILGAIISPTDAVAATAITDRLRVPRRIVTVLDGESLVNDATALVAYRFAIAAMMSGRFSFSEASVRFVLVGEHKNLGASSPTELRKPFGSLIRGDTIGLRCRAPRRYAFTSSRWFCVALAQ